MRSAAEIGFRLRQESMNLRMLLVPPRPPRLPGPPRVLPGAAAIAERLRGTAYAGEVEHLAASVLRHEFPIFGMAIKTGPEIDWRRDYVHGISSEARFFSQVRYLDFGRVGDHKLVWELNRHQHLVLLAQAFVLTGRGEFTDEIDRQLDSWYPQNPWLRGINWTSALEVAFRSLSWIWVDHLAGASLRGRPRLVEELYRHGCYLENNLSHYFSPNTHLLGEAVALHALGAVYPEWASAERWRQIGSGVLEEQVRRQVRDDGSHFEQSLYYHVYALDLFLWHLILARAGGANVSPVYLDRVGRMADFLDVLMGEAGAIPLIGDDDGGRVFHPFGDRQRFGRASLATAAIVLNRDDLPRLEDDLPEQAVWWLGASAGAGKRSSPERRQHSRLFAGAGLAVMNSRDRQIVMDVGPFGDGSGGHSHSDTLSLVVRQGREEVLIDPGTYTYLGDPAWRNLFRGSAAHNTIRVDGRDQAEPAGPFRWANKPDVRLLGWTPGESQDVAAAECRQGTVVHRRTATFQKPGRLVIVDEVEGQGGEHLIEQFWHPGQVVTPEGDRLFRIGAAAVLRTDLEAEVRIVEEWRSTVLGTKVPAPVLCVSRRCALPVRLISAIEFRPALGENVRIDAAPGGASTFRSGLDDK